METLRKKGYRRGKLSTAPIDGILPIPGIGLDRTVPGAPIAKRIGERVTLLDLFERYLQSFGKERVTLRQVQEKDGKIKYVRV